MSDDICSVTLPSVIFFFSSNVKLKMVIITTFDLQTVVVLLFLFGVIISEIFRVCVQDYEKILQGRILLKEYVVRCKND